MRGRKPKPTALNEVRGNPGKRKKKTTKEPTPEPGMPECPAHLSDLAREEWDRIVPELLAVGLLTKIDRTALAGYCAAVGRWQEAEAQLAATGGMVVKAPSGHPIQNPYLAISNRALDDARRFAVEFGMTPSSRTRIGTSEKPASEDPAAKFFSKPRIVS